MQCIRYVLVGAIMGSFVLAACGSPEPDRQERELESAETVERYNDLIADMTQSVRYVAEPLQGLTEEQMASLGALLAMTRVAAHAETVHPVEESSLEVFWQEIDEICPPMPNRPEFRYGGCMDEHIAYVTALSRCRDEGKTEEECEREAAPEMAATVVCEMQKIQEVQGVLGRIPGRDWPPQPFPWPAIRGDTIRAGDRG